MNIKATFVTLSLSLCLGLPQAQAQVSWTGDFETGDTSQYNNELNGMVDGKDYIDVQEDIVLQGTKAVKIELHNDAAWRGNGLKRVELNHRPADNLTKEGETLFFAWSFYLPKTLPQDPAAQIGYWESNQSYRQMMSFGIRGEDITFSTRQPENKVQWDAKGVVTPGQWHRIAMSVKWSKDPSNGEVSVWFDGTKVVDGAKAKTLNDDNPHFIQVGLLRGKVEFQDVPVIYIDDAVEGASLQDVRPDLPKDPVMEPEPDMAMPPQDMSNGMPDMSTASEDMAQAPQDMGSNSSDMSPNPAQDMNTQQAQPDASNTQAPDMAMPVEEQPGFGKQSYSGCTQAPTSPTPFALLMTSLLGLLALRRRRRV